MSRRVVIVALALLALVQLAVPLRMIAKREDTLRTGELFRFRAAPIDPYDAFRGRYVALALAADTVVVDDAGDYTSGERIFVLLATDEQGFARPIGVERGHPPKAAYVEARVAWRAETAGALRISYPFDRYYMNEELAPAAEQAYRQHAGGEARETWVAVRIKQGFAVLEELYVGGRPIGELLARGDP